MRYSRQREALLQLLRSTKTHPDAEWLYTGLRKEYPNISLGTVYRNLRQLTECGDVLELCYAGASHFDGDISPHHHMRCSCCNRIFDVPIENVSVSIKSENGFEIRDVSLTLTGVCRDCQKEI